MGHSDGGFSLIEVLVSTAIAMAMTTLAVVVYLQMRQIMGRYEALTTMNDQAQALYSALYRDFQAAMPSCGFCVLTSAGSVDLIMMRGKEDSYDFDPNESVQKSDLVWDQWHFAGTTLSHALSSPSRSFAPSSTGMQIGGQTYGGGVSFLNLPQPRRWLDPTTPTATLDDNIYFPSAPPAGPSLASSNDVGDFGDLRANLMPVAAGISGLTLQLVFHDGTTQTFNASGSTGQGVYPGVWMDGRLGARNSDPPSYVQSPIIHRPEMVRILFSLSAPNLTASQSYSFSFPLPALGTGP
jgi:hypothetical protein